MGGGEEKERVEGDKCVLEELHEKRIWNLQKW